MTSRSENANHYTIEASYIEEQIVHVESYVLLFCEVKIKMHVTYNEWILVSKLQTAQTLFLFSWVKTIYFR